MRTFRTTTVLAVLATSLLLIGMAAAPSSAITRASVRRALPVTSVVLVTVKEDVQCVKAPCLPVTSSSLVVTVLIPNVLGVCWTNFHATLSDTTALTPTIRATGKLSTDDECTGTAGGAAEVTIPLASGTLIPAKVQDARTRTILTVNHTETD